MQGIALDRDSIWVTSVDAPNRKGYLHQFNRATMRLERQIEVTDGPRFHPGGFSMQKDSIWIPFAEYTPHSSTVLEELDKKTLMVKRKISVADSLGCVALMSDGLVAGNWDSRQFYIFDKDGKQLRIVDNPQENKYQDLRFASGALVASGVFTRTTGAIDWLDWPSLKLMRRLKAGPMTTVSSSQERPWQSKETTCIFCPKTDPAVSFTSCSQSPDSLIAQNYFVSNQGELVNRPSSLGPLQNSYNKVR